MKNKVQIGDDGEFLSQFCPDCGAHGRYGARFCDNCGRLLSAPRVSSASYSHHPIQSANGLKPVNGKMLLSQLLVGVGVIALISILGSSSFPTKWSPAGDNSAFVLPTTLPTSISIDELIASSIAPSATAVAALFQNTANHPPEHIDLDSTCLSRIKNTQDMISYRQWKMESLSIISLDKTVNCHLTMGDLRGPVLGDFSWSPDGKNLVYSYFGSGIWGLAVLDLNAQTLHYLTRNVMGMANDRLPTWSSDGKYIAFVANREMPYSGIYVVDSDDLSVHQIMITYPRPHEIGKSISENIISLSWSPDDKQLYFDMVYTTEDNQTASSFYSIDADGSNQHELWRKSDKNYGEPILSPDGRSLAIITAKPGDQNPRPRNYVLSVMDVDGSNLRQLISGCLGGSPSWSPDGKSLAFLSCTNPDFPPRYGIDIINADGSKLQHLIEGDSITVDTVAWMPGVPKSEVGMHKRWLKQ